MNQEELRLHRCCFTGHRPDKMELGEKEIKPLLEKAIDDAIADGYVTFITGMAMGTDIWAAEIVLNRKKTNKDLHLICALPHPNFESRRSTGFENIGKLTIANGEFDTELVKTETYTKTDADVDAYIAEINESYAELGNRKIGESKVELITHNEEGVRLVEGVK